MSDPGTRLLDEALSPDRVFLTRAVNKADLIHFLVDALAASGEVQDVEMLRSAIFTRENLMSTGIGLGIGVPHARISSVRRMVMAAAINAPPLRDYESIDGQPVEIVFLVAGRPDQQSNYVRLLASLSKLMKDPARRKAVLQSQTPADAYEQLRP